MVPDIIAQSGFTLTDVAIVVIFLLAVVIGAVRGLFRTLAGLMILILALVGGSVAARFAAPPVAERIYPILEERISEEMRQELLDALKDPLSEAAGDLSKLLPDGASGRLNSFLKGAGLTPGGEVPEIQNELLEPVLRAAVESAVRTVLRALFFLLILILLLILAKAVDLMMKLPVLHQFNALGGALIGAAEGILFVLLFLWAAKLFGLDPAASRIVQALPFL